MCVKRSNGRNVFPTILLVAALFWIFSFSNVNADTIIDNGDLRTSYTGAWQVSGGPEPWDHLSDPSATSLWSRDGDTYTWTFTPTDSGYHDFSMWWTEYPSRSNSVPVTIRYWGGTDTFPINQQTDGGQWNPQGTYPFEAGVSYDITITSQPGPSSTNADAVQFIYQPGLNVLPGATIDSISPNPAPTDALVTFTGHGDDLDGTITGWRWDSDKDGTLGSGVGNPVTFTTSGPLSLGTHIISFTVVDDNSEESEPVTQTLTVQDTINEVIIDNGDPETSFTGSWNVSGGADPWDHLSDPSATSLYSRNGDTYTWTFTPAISGNYEFSMWWTQFSSRSPNIPVSIEYSGGTGVIITDTVPINQQENGGDWYPINTYPFEAGVSYDITITAVPGGTQNYSTCADAVRFVYTGSINQLPVATIDSISPKVTVPGDVITLQGSYVDSDGTVTGFEWRSDIDGILSYGIPGDPNTNTFSTDTLSQGTHTIFFRVQDDQNAWSKEAVALVVVRDCNSPVTIMPLGNSITYGVGEISGADLITGFRQPLFQSLKSAGYYTDFVGDRSTGLLVVPPFDIDHQGVPGITASEVAVNVYNWLVAHPAEIVLLHIGTNDNSTNPGAVETILDEIDRYETVQGKKVTVVLARIINRMTPNPDTTTFNNNVQAMAEARIAAGDKIVIVDQESALTYPTDMWDNLHPNTAGYNKMDDVWINALADLLPVCSDFGPFIFTSPITGAMLDFPYTYNVGALGNPAPSYSLLVGAPGMSIDPTTGVISWTPASGLEGIHDITVQAQNSEGTDTQNFSIDVSGSIIIDNGDPETSFTGSWGVSGGPDPWDHLADPSATSLWSRDGDTYTWTFTPPVSGDYAFSIWWTQYSSRSPNIPVSIEYSGGTGVVTSDTVPINQQENGGDWYPINTYPFEAGVSYDITITAVPGGAQNYSTCADAVRFVLLSTSTSHTITATSGANGSITPSGTVTVNDGANQAFSISPAGGYHVAGVLVDGSSVGAVTSYTFTNVTANHTIAASFEVDVAVTHTITATSGANGSITPSGTVTVNDGANQAFSISPAGGYHVAGVLVDGSSVGAVTSYTFTNVTANHTIAASFEVDVAVTHTITATSGANGSITPSGTVTVNDGANQAFSISPAGGYHVAGVLVDGSSVGAVTSYTFTNVTSDHTIAASFEVGTSTAPVAFNDKTDTLVGVPVMIDVVANDSDSDGTIDPTTVSITQVSGNGTTVEQGDGTVLYTPNSGYSGKDTFKYTVQDDQGVLSNEATVTVTVGIVIDNGDPETSFTGSWGTSGGLNPWDYLTDPSATSLWSRNGDTYTWTFTPSVAGNYEISIWYTYLSSRSDNIPLTIDNWNGTATTHINQQTNDGQWNSIGTYPFQAGVSYDITITSVDGGTANYSTCADAVRFVYLPTNVTPLAMIDSMTSSAAPGQPVAFSGSGMDFEGGITAYSWYSTLDGPLSDQPSFSTTGLSEGVHTIFFKVQDEDGEWSPEVQATVDINDSTVATTEHIFIAPGYATVNATPLMVSTLQSIGATQSGGLWYYSNNVRNKNYIIHFVDTEQEWLDALKWQDAVVLYFGHSNYGSAQLFATDAEFNAQVIEDIRYVNDDRLINISSPIVHVSVSGMRTGQAYPHWWFLYKDGTDARVPYDFGDPSGRDPAYNYYPTYQVPGDPTHYKIETVRRSAIERFSDSRVDAWYDPDGYSPDPTSMDDLKYFITNPDPWFPSIERIGNWVDTNVLTGFYRENYEYSTAGSGSDQMTWLFSIPEDGDYNVFVWYPASSTNSTNAPFTVNYEGGSTTVPVNQRLNGGQWNMIGTYHFGVADYSVVLTDNASGGNVIADGVRIEHADNPPEVLRAHFFATNRSGPAPLDVNFTSDTLGDVDHFEWSFGDGNINATRTSITHTYTDPGTYTVTYTVSGPLGTDSRTEVGYIVVGDSEEPLKAEFESRSSQNGTAPRTIRFRDQSSGDIVSWAWDFDDDGIVDSTEQSPSFEYTDPGIYTVSLTVTDSNADTDTQVKADFIRIIRFDKNIDNVDYPKTHFGSKTLLYRKDLPITKAEMKYARMYYGGCDSGHYYTDMFQRGIYHYATNSTGEGEYGMAEYLKAYVGGKSDYEIWQIIQAIEPLYDYYDFRKTPSEQY